MYKIRDTACRITWKPSQTELICASFKSLVWYALDQALPREKRVAMRVTALVESIYRALAITSVTRKVVECEIDRLRNDRTFIYLPKSDAIGLVFRTLMPDASVFPDDVTQILENRPSAVHGTGTFSKAPIEAGTNVRCYYKGTIRYKWETDEWDDQQDCYNMTVPGYRFLTYCGGDLNNPKFEWPNKFLWFANMASNVEDANVEFWTLPETPWLVHLRATKNIKAGDELLLDTYGDEYQF